MKGRELANLGMTKPAIKPALSACAELAARGATNAQVRDAMAAVLVDPERFLDHEVLAETARVITRSRGIEELRREGGAAPLRTWGEVGVDFDRASLEQMHAACRLPVAVAGAMMPDAHVGYGLPIGGVLATENAVIPYAVGVDIACRMRLSVLDLPAGTLHDPRGRDRLRDALESQTRFGIGAAFNKPRSHDVMDRDWSVTSVTHRCKSKAWSQLGTSGSGNHFVEFGVLRVGETSDVAAGALGMPVPGQTPFDLPPGEYLALMSHSGSRGSGAAVCDHYSRLAMERLRNLAKDQRFLAWLEMDSAEGQEYWAAMSLMGEYASANHAVIHREILRHLGARAAASVENHHNFAWVERHEIDGRERELIVHRKGATPAARGVLGVIPGSMASPAFVVVGLGGEQSLASASHGAGRVMSRTQAKASFAWGNVRRELDGLGVEVLSAGIDEVPGVYKDIHTVMARQQDLVAPIARFDPVLVKMAPAGEKAED